MERRQQAPNQANNQAAGQDHSQQQRNISFGCIKVAIDQAEKLASRESWRDSFKKLMSSIVQVTPISTLQACSLIPYDSVPVSDFKFLQTIPYFGKKELHTLFASRIFSTPLLSACG